MRVLELTCEPILFGGQESFIFNVLQNLHDNRLKIDVLTLYYCSNEYYREIASKYGVNIYELNLEFKPGKSRRIIIEPLRVFLRDHQYDVIHIHSGSISALAYSAEVANAAGIKKIIVHSHSTGISNIRHRIIQSVFAEKFNRNVNVFCACSEDAGRMKFPANKLKELIVLKNGIDLHKFKYDHNERNIIREELAISKDAYVVGQIGRYTFEKNQRFTVELANDIANRDKSIYFILIGDGELREQTVGMIKDNSNIVLLGSRSDVWRYYNAMDLLILPSLYEGIPLVSIEAQANGLPILASSGVSDKIEINSNVKRLSLESKAEWEKIISERQLERMLPGKALSDSGWNIYEVANKLEKLYLENK